MQSHYIQYLWQQFYLIENEMEYTNRNHISSVAFCISSLEYTFYIGKQNNSKFIYSMYTQLQYYRGGPASEVSRPKHSLK